MTTTLSADNKDIAEKFPEEWDEVPFQVTKSHEKTFHLGKYSLTVAFRRVSYDGTVGEARSE